MSARLIPEWTRYTDHNNQFYFLHEDTGESRWMLPESEEGMFIDGDEDMLDLKKQIGIEMENNLSLPEVMQVISKYYVHNSIA